MFLILILILMFASIVLVAMQILPVASERVKQIQNIKVEKADKKFDNMFMQVNKNKLAMFYTISPLALGLVGFVIFNNLLVAFGFALVGLFVPNIFINILERRRRQRFQSQIVDGLMVMSSSLKAGLSLLQAIEVLHEEMPAPISEEFGLVLRQNKMGMSMDEALKDLDKRMNLRDLNLMITAVLVAKETGGDLTRVLSRLVTAIRDNQKLKENIKTLTLQGKLQGIIMSVLPFLFVSWVLTFNRRHFDIMLNNDIGRMLLIGAVLLQIVGMFLIHKFSTIKI